MDQQIFCSGGATYWPTQAVGRGPPSSIKIPFHVKRIRSEIVAYTYCRHTHEPKVVYILLS